ncbi:MAG: hypothetical protein WCF65_08535 [Parachlamydiaceae bacterium]
MSYLSQLVIASQNFVQHLWPHVEDLTIKELPRFGAEQWDEYYGINIQDAPPVPETLISALDSPCPYWNDLKVKDTHLLCLIPQGLTSKQLWEHSVKATIGIPLDDLHVPDHSYWILITKKTLPDSRKTGFDEMQDILQDKGYSVPTLLEALSATLAVRKTNNFEIYPLPRGYTKCQEQYAGFHLAVGSEGYSLAGIMTNDWNNHSGVAAVRKD